MSHRKGEYLANLYLQSQGYAVEDVSLNRNYWNKDIDLIARKENKEIKIEVKWDSRIHHTGNMFIETETDVDLNRAGWFKFCEADYIFYGDEKRNLFYIFKNKDLQEFVQKNASHLEKRKAPDYNYKKQIRKISQGFLVPMDEFSQEYNVQVVMLSEC